MYFKSFISQRDGELKVNAVHIQMIHDDIAAHFAEHNLTAGAVAERLGVSVRHIHLTLEATGRSFSDLLLDRRLRQAWMLLFHSRRLSLRIAQIAHRCGFSDLAFFNRTFRRRYGMTASALRRDTRCTTK